jgi:hypothetical protein
MICHETTNVLRSSVLKNCAGAALFQASDKLRSERIDLLEQIMTVAGTRLLE